MQSKTEKRIENVKEEIAKLNNKKNVLIQKHKAEERRARTHRLCKRGGYMESKIPELLTMTDEEFYSFVDNILIPQHSNKS
ncbi:MAG: DUF3847 domain-containing protein [Oscillospiraceae bacterium]|nr:DUF3847 domain-containing protein [Oscillospiraceae bacterium]